jgi:hypothetical protein
LTSNEEGNAANCAVNLKPGFCILWVKLIIRSGIFYPITFEICNFTELPVHCPGGGKVLIGEV